MRAVAITASWRIGIPTPSIRAFAVHTFGNGQLGIRVTISTRRRRQFLRVRKLLNICVACEAIESGMYRIVQMRHVDEKRSLRTCAVRSRQFPITMAHEAFFRSLRRA